MATPLFSVPQTSKSSRKSVSRAVRLFVALWPDGATQQALLAAGEPFGALGRRIPARNLHVTMAFIGNVAPEKVDLISSAMEDARPQACDFVLDRFGHFNQSRVLWAAAAQVPESLVAYQRRLGAALSAAGFRIEKHAFRLHVTLLRDCAKPTPEQVQTPLSIPWQVREIALVQSELEPGGSRYEVIRRVAARA